MQRSFEVQVSEQQHGEHLDRFIAHHTGLSRRLARLLIAQGLVSINGKTVKILTKPLKKNDVLAWSTQDLPQEHTTVQKTHVEVLFHDRYCLVVNKPSGLLSEHDRFGSPCIETWAQKWLQSKGEKPEVWLVHRLDAVTSGVLVLARTPMAVKNLSASFREGTVHKEYWAVCKGILNKPLHVQAPVGRVRGTQHGVVEGGKPAETFFEPLSHGAEVSLVVARPKTGRTHQIRVHLAHVQHPIVGDTLYAGPRYITHTPPVPVPRTMLHARSLRIQHPKTGEWHVFKASLPSDFLSVAQHAGYRTEMLESKPGI